MSRKTGQTKWAVIAVLSAFTSFLNGGVQRLMSLLGQLAFLATCMLLGLFLPVLARAQGQSVPQNSTGSQRGVIGTVGEATAEVIRGGSITVTITDEKGQSLAATSRITISSNNSSILKPPTREGKVWEFQALPSGDEYAVEVDTPGYESELRFVTLGPPSGTSKRVEFHLRPAASRTQPNLDTSHLLLSPLAMRELQQGLKSLRSKKVGAAREHLEDVLKSNPSSAQVNYLVGLTYLLENRGAKATPYLEKAMVGDPKQVGALITLGAIQLLTKALQKDPGFWQINWILAEANLQEGEYAEAYMHAQIALARGQGRAARAELIVGEALVGMGKLEEGAVALERYVRTGDLQAQDWMNELREPATAAATAKEIIAQVTEGGAPRRNTTTVFPPDPFVGASWMPPDVDAAKPPVMTQRACPLLSVLKKAGKGMEQFITNLDNFSATEEFQSARVNDEGQVGKPKQGKFDYFFFVDRLGPHRFAVGERRDQQFALAEMGAPVMDKTSAALAAAFHPDYRSDFEWRCEGLGAWKGKPAWVIRFQQRSDRPTSRLKAFVTSTNEYQLPIKGRAWLMEMTGQVLHLEADLMTPLKQVKLECEHFSIDYREVAFISHPVKLWLPEDVNTYIEYRSHRYYQYHHFGDFLLFWVSADQKIGKPKTDTAEGKPRGN